MTWKRTRTQTTRTKTMTMTRMGKNDKSKNNRALQLKTCCTEFRRAEAGDSIFGLLVSWRL